MAPASSVQQKMCSLAGSTWEKGGHRLGRVTKLKHYLWGVGMALTLWQREVCMGLVIRSPHALW